MNKTIGILLFAGFVAVRGFAASGALDPIGVVRISCPGSSDTIVSLPLNRPTVFEGLATASTITANAVGTLHFSGSPFTADIFKYSAGTQPNTYFAFVASGNKEGCYYTITGNTANALTIDLNGDTFSAIPSAVTVKVIPFWTLGTVFPNGAGVAASAGFSVATQVLLPDPTTAGTNLAASAIYHYSAAVGWMRSGAAGSAGDTVLYPDSPFTIRNNAAATTTFALVGAVAMNKLSVPLATNVSARQDNAVGLARPIPVTLDDSGLVSSGAFSASSGFIPGDQLFVYDNAAAQLNKAAARIYFYANGAWRRSGVSGDVGADPILTPGTGVLIRKAVTSTGVTATWSIPRNFSN